MSKHVAIYVRVSSKKQETRSQEPDLKQWMAVQDEPVRWYRDKYTGTTMERPGWQRLERDMAAGLVSKVVIWRLDRLGRTARGLTALFEDLRSRKIGLVSVGWFGPIDGCGASDGSRFGQRGPIRERSSQ